MSEQRIKVWRMLNWPNRISLLRLLLIAPFLIVLLSHDELGDWSRYWALAIFTVMAISDFVDGQLARRLNLRTRLGAVLDPLADKALIICSVVLLSIDSMAVPGFAIPSWVVVAVVGKDVWVLLGFVVVYLVTDRFRVQPTWAGKAATFAQLVMVITVLLGPDIEAIRPGLGQQVVFVLFLLVTTVSILAVISYTRLGLGFVLQGQQPLHEHNSRSLSEAIGEALKRQDEPD